MKTIYKYTLKMTPDVQEIALPKWSQLLTAQIQEINNDAGYFREIVLWVNVDTSMEMIKRKFKVLMTGQPWDEDCSCTNYISTCQDKETGLVFHVFEVQ